MDVCTTNSYCSSGNCTNGFCVGKAIGTSCTLYSDCVSNAYCSGGICTQRKASGFSFTKDYECTAGYLCNLGFCVKKYSLLAGQSVDNNRACVSMNSVNGICEDLINCNYTTSITNTPVSIFSRCVCNPDGSGNDLCYLSTNSTEYLNSILTFQANSSVDCPYDNEGGCKNVPISQMNEYVNAQFGLVGLSSSNFPCLQWNSSSFLSLSGIIISLFLMILLN